MKKSKVIIITVAVLLLLSSAFLIVRPKLKKPVFPGTTIDIDYKAATAEFKLSEAALDTKLPVYRAVRMKIKNSEVQKLLAAIGAEALTNAVRHADAKQLEIHLSETDTDFIAVYTNDGLPPSSPIAEGGGLTSARRKIESAGGEMTVAHAPRFTLTVSIRKEVNEDV